MSKKRKAEEGEKVQGNEEAEKAEVHEDKRARTE